jgi:MFS transporter, NNP family, nitrate/nitrite transporter
MLRGLLSFRGPYRILNLSWMAFFLTFVVWFSYAPFVTTIQKDLGLSLEQARTLTLCNLALTIPARIIIGMVLDRVGPRITYSLLLLYAVFPTLAFATAQDFNQLVWSRLAMSIVGAGFVIGIRLVAEWFDPKQMGIAQGIYGGWGNFGSFGAKAGLPILATVTAFNANQANWRGAIAFTGILCAVFSVIFYLNVQDTPPGKVYQSPAKSGGMEVTSARSFWGLLALNLPLFGALGLIGLNLMRVKWLSPTGFTILVISLLGLYAMQSYQAWVVNREVVAGKKRYPASDRYKMLQVALLGIAYIVSFGSELAVVSMLPEFFERTFGLNYAVAGPVAACYPMINLVARPAGGWFCDWLGNRKWALTGILAGIGLTYLMVAQIQPTWPLPFAIAILMLSALFVCAGAGATFAIAPLIQRRVTGQIAGLIGAYGSLGSVLYAAIYTVLPSTGIGNTTFFQILALTALVTCALCAAYLKDPTIDPSTTGEVEALTVH